MATSTRERERVFCAVAEERNYQDAKWGSIADRPHTVGEWLLIMQGELEEACQAWRKGNGDMAALAEIVQVAAVAVACMEQHGTVNRRGQWHLARQPQEDKL